MESDVENLQRSLRDHAAHLDKLQHTIEAADSEEARLRSTLEEARAVAAAAQQKLSSGDATALALRTDARGHAEVIEGERVVHAKLHEHMYSIQDTWRYIDIHMHVCFLILLVLVIHMLIYAR